MPKTLVSWNVNGMRSVLKNGFMDWFTQAKPDVVCLQETRVLPSELTQDVLEPKGYVTYWMPAQKKGYSGVAAFVKKRLAPDNVTNMGIEEFDDEGRVQILEFPEFSVINAYYPNSQPEGKRLDYKLRFCDAMKAICDKTVKKGRHVIVCGDYNISHKPIDLARPKANEKNPGYLPEEREAMTQFLEGGYVDTFRHFNQEPDNYSWWSYRGGARAKNVGWRLDYHCVNADLADRLKKASIHADVMGSDHCPVSITLKK